jgi:hypothetical protein
MKLERLNSPKLGDFKANEIQNSFMVIGGAIIATESGSYKDTYDTSSDKTSTGGQNSADFKSATSTSKLSNPIGSVSTGTMTSRY